MGLADSVFRLFRENSDVVPLNRLKKQGVKNVTVLDWSRIQQLIEKAVEEALARRNIDLDPAVLASVHRDAKEAFHRLVEQRDRLEETTRTLAQEKDDLARNLDALRAEIARSQSELAAERAKAARYDDAAKSLLDAGKQPVIDPAALEQRQKVEQLERRLAKLQRALDDSEQVVEKLKLAKEGDPGIESIYKNVQGLDPKDGRADQKRGLLDQVFRLNLELRDVIAAGAKPAPSRAIRTEDATNAASQ